MSVDKTYLVPLWEPTGRQMTEMEALVHTLLTHNAALQREVDELKAWLSSMERDRHRDLKMLNQLWDRVNSLEKE